MPDKSPNVPIFSAPQSNLSLLPPLVARIRSKILEVAHEGDIEKLRSPIEWNELLPMFDRGGKGADHYIPGSDPIEFLKNQSFDKNGREILQILIAMFESPFCQMQQGQYISYVWPAFAFVPSPPADEDERVRRWRGVRFADLGKLDPDGQPFYYRANIGFDGTWHYFWSGA